MNNTITIEIDGVKYEGWTNITITKSLTDFCGTFTFTGTSIKNEPFPIKRRAEVKIFVNDIQVINGYVEKIDVGLSTRQHEIVVGGRDKTADIKDSKLGSDFVIDNPATLLQLTNKVLDKMNLTGKITASTPFALEPFKTADKPEVGVGAFEFLQRNATKRQVLMTTDYSGNIVYDRAGEIIYNTILSTQPGDPTTIISSAAKFDDTKRFNVYAMSNQSDTTVNIFEKTPVDNRKAVSVKTTATDDDIRTSRIYYFSSEDTSNDNDGQSRAQWELDYRKAHAFTYTAIVQGFKPLFDDDIWRPNRLVRINDIACSMNTTLLITNVQFSQSASEGSVTTLDFVSRDSFMLQTRKRKHKRQVKESDQGENIFG